MEAGLSLGSPTQHMAETLLWGNRQLEGGDCCKGHVCRGDLGSPGQGRWTFFLILKTPRDIPAESVDLTVALRSWTVAHSQHRVIIETVTSQRHAQSEPPGNRT